jgi:hypothetical protein
MKPASVVRRARSARRNGLRRDLLARRQLRRQGDACHAAFSRESRSPAAALRLPAQTKSRSATPKTPPIPPYRVTIPESNMICRIGRLRHVPRAALSRPKERALSGPTLAWVASGRLSSVFESAQVMLVGSEARIVATRMARAARAARIAVGLPACASRVIPAKLASFDGNRARIEADATRDSNCWAWVHRCRPRVIAQTNRLRGDNLPDSNRSTAAWIGTGPRVATPRAVAGT